MDEAPRRPLGVTFLALVYIVLGSQSLALGLYLLTLTPGTAPGGIAAVLARTPGIVQYQGWLLLLCSVPFMANGVLLLRGWWRARWATVALTPLHVLGLPFGLGGLLFALLANLYLFGSGRARAWFDHLRGRPVAQPS